MRYIIFFIALTAGAYMFHLAGVDNKYTSVDAYVLGPMPAKAEHPGTYVGVIACLTKSGEAMAFMAFVQGAKDGGIYTTDPEKCRNNLRHQINFLGMPQPKSIEVMPIPLWMYKGV